MEGFSDIFNIFSSGEVKGGTPVQQPAPQSGLFENLIRGAVRGVEQTFATSEVGTKLSGFLAQGQSQAAAQSFFGNPIILLAVMGLALFGIVAIIKR